MNARIERHLVKQAIEIRELKRRLLNTVREGKVVEHSTEDPRLIKVDIGPEGQPVNTPWIEWSERAGAVKTYGRPSLGERVLVSSPDGELGTASRAIAGGFSSDNESPAGQDGELLMTIGGSSFRFHADGLELTGKLEVHGDVKANDGVFEHEAKNVGNDHKHTEVMKGGAVTGPPEG